MPDLAAAGLEVRTVEGRGRCLFARRRLRAGDVVFAGPAFVSCVRFSQAPARCARCLRRRPLQRCRACSLVGYCSDKCRRAAAQDHEVECKALPYLVDKLRAEGEVVWHDGDALHNALMLARVLRARPSPSHPVAKLASPMAGKALVLRSAIATQRLSIPAIIARIVVEFARAHPRVALLGDFLAPPGASSARRAWPPEPPAGAADPDIEALVAVLLQQQVNACCVFDPELDASEEASLAEGLFLDGALCNHSCSPNCQFMYRLGAGGAQPLQYVLCVADVQPGEELTVSYSDVSRPFWQRRARLEQSHWFRCTCSRCQQETTLQGLVREAHLARMADVHGRLLRAALRASSPESAAPERLFEKVGVTFAASADEQRAAKALQDFAGLRASFVAVTGAAEARLDLMRQARQALREIEAVLHPQALLLFDIRVVLLNWAEASQDWTFAVQLATALCLASRDVFYELHPHRCALLEALARAATAAGLAEQAAEAERAAAEMRSRLYPPVECADTRLVAESADVAASDAWRGATDVDSERARELAAEFPIDVAWETASGGEAATASVRIADGVLRDDVAVDISRDSVRISIAGAARELRTPFAVDVEASSASFSTRPSAGKLRIKVRRSCVM